MEATNLVGFVLPPFIDFINKRIPNSKVRFWVSIAFCAGLAAFFNLDSLKGGNPQEFFASAGIIFTEAQVIYKQWYENSQAREVVKSMTP